ncbi:HAMP domain-containing sensor histidine kinase [Brevundimonas sp.]|uniref:sensor histidine kinase n=1 Tax=Brevundimonas sp. TaxID=1871086 RepID=UPI001AC8C2F6|nr:HAMP domain-containing sensor histidine kinase [Brevundimonas sp.]MBN9464931.1 HAMP domain-containing histidine kinase [Brevundimonas sp.]
MTRRRVFGTAALRLAAAFAVVFAVGGTLMFAIFQWGITDYTQRSIDDDLRVETEILLADRGSETPEALARRIQSRTRIVGLLAYGLFDASGQRIAGTLPAETAQTPGLGRIDLPEPPDNGVVQSETVEVRTLTTAVGATTLVVGKSTYAVHELQEWLSEIAVAAALATALLAVAGGFTAGTILARRLDRVNAATTRIMNGHLNDRLPPIGLGSEFETLRDNLNQMLDRLEAAMAAMRHVSSDVAHDLRTPLNRLRQRLEDARRRQDTVDDLKATLEAATVDLDGALDIFAALLRIAQIEGGTDRAHFRMVRASDVIRRVYEAYQPVADEAGHTLTLLADSDSFIEADEDLLVQMLSNLVENAIVHAPGPVRIIVEAHDEGERTTLAVRDNGAGIPASDLSQVTRRFHRLDQSRHTPGSGLGLALVSAIAGLHRTKLVLGSNGPGLSARVSLQTAMPSEPAPA